MNCSLWFLIITGPWFAISPLIFKLQNVATILVVLTIIDLLAIYNYETKQYQDNTNDNYGNMQTKDSFSGI